MGDSEVASRLLPEPVALCATGSGEGQRGIRVTDMEVARQA